MAPTDSVAPWNSPGQNTGVGSPSPGDLHNPGIEPRSPTLQADSLPAEPQGKRKNTGVGSLSLPQQIFPIQELNRGLLHCRQILYQLSYQGSPCRSITSPQNEGKSFIVHRSAKCLQLSPLSLVSGHAKFTIFFFPLFLVALLGMPDLSSLTRSQGRLSRLQGERGVLTTGNPFDLSSPSAC